MRTNGTLPRRSALLPSHRISSFTTLLLSLKFVLILIWSGRFNRIIFYKLKLLLWVWRISIKTFSVENENFERFLSFYCFGGKIQGLDQVYALRLLFLGCHQIYSYQLLTLLKLEKVELRKWAVIVVIVDESLNIFWHTWQEAPQVSIRKTRAVNNMTFLHILSSYCSLCVSNSDSYQRINDSSDVINVFITFAHCYPNETPFDREPIHCHIAWACTSTSTTHTHCPERKTLTKVWHDLSSFSRRLISIIQFIS